MHSAMMHLATAHSHLQLQQLPSRSLLNPQQWKQKLAMQQFQQWTR
jgi:hypothetical protein